MNKDIKYEGQSKQLKELNEIYQNFLALESERNKTILILNDNNNIAEKNEIENNYNNLNYAVKYDI